MPNMYTGPPCGQKFIKVDNYFGKQSRYKGGALGTPSQAVNFQQDEIYEVFYSVRT